MDHFLPYLILLAEGVGALAVLWGAFKLVFKPLFLLIFKPVIKIHRLIERISRELSPNGGSSLRDRIDLIQEHIYQIRAWQRSRLSHDKECFWDLDKDGYFVYGNKAMFRWFGAAESDLMGKNFHNFIAEGDRTRVNKEIKNAFKYHSDFKIECDFLTVTGDTKKAEIEGFVILGGKKELLGYSCVLIGH